jgi:RNase P/RNase MRP subunit p30
MSSEIMLASALYWHFFFFFFAEDEQFEADKAQIVKEIAALEPRE